MFNFTNGPGGVGGMYPGASLEGAQGEQLPQEFFSFSIVKDPKNQPLIYFDYYQKIFAPGVSKSQRGPWLAIDYSEAFTQNTFFFFQ